MVRASLLPTLVLLLPLSGCARQAPPDQLAPVVAQERVPEVAPNLQPSTLADDLVPNGNGDMVSTGVLSVSFRLDATQSQRQAAIDSVGGKVIGGVNVDGVGWYYVEVEGDGTIEKIYEIGHTVNALPQVELAGPYTVFGLQ